MIFDFTYYNPTKIYFGRNAMSNLEGELLGYGNKVLLVYGKGAIKKIGLYDEVIKALENTGKEVFELEGIKSNPTLSSMLRGAEMVREHDIDLILAVGGGSVIDCAKGISVSAYCEGDPWKKYWEDFEAVSNRIVPVASILTMTGTASEMNAGSVITNDEKMIKDIKKAAIVGYICSGITALLGLLMFNIGIIIEVLLMFGLLLGMHLGRKKWCAMTYMCIAILDCVVSMALTGSPSG